MARRVMEANEETNCMIVSAVQQDGTDLGKEEIIRYMTQEKLSSFF